jgi:acid phosphatase
MMKLNMKSSLILFILTISFNFTYSQTPLIVNLQDAKNAVKQYHTSEQYIKDMDKIVDDALLNIRQLKLPPNPAFVFDIDETALSNLPYELKYSFGYDPKTWDEWILEAAAPALAPVKRFYDSLVARGIHILLITGRKANLYDATISNLKKEGYVKFDTLICKGSEFSGKKAVEYKSQKRMELSQKYNIIGSIGDQWSDSEGGWTILKIKLPNYMYFIE